MEVFNKGAGVRISVEFADFDGQLADPTEVLLKVRPPGGAFTLVTAIKDSTGNYHANVVLTISGDWKYRWEATGPLITGTLVDEGVISVRASGF